MDMEELKARLNWLIEENSPDEDDVGRSEKLLHTREVTVQVAKTVLFWIDGVER